MIPIPTYLRDKALITKTSKTWTSFSLVCNCGCRSFIPYENFYTSEEKRAMQPYYDTLHYLLSGRWGSTSTKDADGTLHHWKLLSPSGLNGPKEEVFIPQQPFFAGISVIKVNCENCGTKHLVFDSRYHGYDGVTGTRGQEEFLYQPHFRSKCRNAVGIEIKVENDPSIKDFEENTGLRFTEEEYSNSFSWIKIFAVNSDGKKRVIFDRETA